MFEKSIGEAINVMAQYGETMIFEAEKTAPRKTGYLKAEAMTVENPKLIGNKLVMVLNLNATDASGQDYGSKQHDEKLRHAVPEGAQTNVGFADLASHGHTLEERYRIGYAEHAKDFPAYRSKFLERGVDAQFDEMAQAILETLDW